MHNQSNYYTQFLILESKNRLNFTTVNNTKITLLSIEYMNGRILNRVPKCIR